MSKKRAQRQKKQAKKKPFRIVKQQNQSKKFVEAKPNLETEPRNIETQKIPNSAKRIPDKDLEKEKPNVLNYYNNSLYKIFYTYSSDILNNYLEQEKNKENLVQITEETLSIFAISREQRKYAFKYLYETIEEKAANFLYLIIKNHVFIDGNKRIAATLFIYFLEFYNILYVNDKQVIDNNTLVALTLLIAQSNPKEKNILIDLVMNFLKNDYFK